MKGVSVVIRGACQQFKFHIPYQKSQLQEIQVMFWQPDNNGTESCTLPIIKELKGFDESDEGQDVLIDLHQIETFAFNCDSKALVQLRGLTKTGCVFASRIKPIKVYPTGYDTLLELSTE